jgi:hypothetical protein
MTRTVNGIAPQEYGAATLLLQCRRARMAKPKPEKKPAAAGGRSMKGLVLLAWYFAVVGGTVGPFDSLADCEGVRVLYHADTRGWTSKCWETQK